MNIKHLSAITVAAVFAATGAHAGYGAAPIIAAASGGSAVPVVIVLIVLAAIILGNRTPPS